MASKMKSNLQSMSLVLLFISLVASGLLAYVYKLTKDPIELANKQKTIDALAMVLPKFDNEPLKDNFMAPVEGGDSILCYVARKNGKVVGIAIESYTKKAFSGTFKVIVGFTPDGVIYNTIMLEQHETPGLGDKADKSKSNWSDQFNGKNPLNFRLKVKKDGGDIDAITAATITSRAYTDAVDRAYKVFTDYVKPKLGI